MSAQCIFFSHEVMQNQEHYFTYYMEDYKKEIEVHFYFLHFRQCHVFINWDQLTRTAKADIKTVEIEK